MTLLIHLIFNVIRLVFMCVLMEVFVSYMIVGIQLTLNGIRTLDQIIAMGVIFIIILIIKEGGDWLVRKLGDPLSS